jgi:tRNA-5-taurinomethyluridine 2-sulfurtransferase
MHRQMQFVQRICSKTRGSLARAFSAPAVVALSGGVDSAVAAALTLAAQDASASVTALHMSNWNHRMDEDEDYAEEVTSCSSDTDYNDAVRVASLLHLPLHRCQFESDYWCHVFQPYVEQLMEGAMGSPDLDCNRHVKFGALCQYIQRRWGPVTTLITGHYARLWYRHLENSEERRSVPECVEETVQTDPSRWTKDLDWLRNSWGGGSSYSTRLPPLLLTARDSTKDQSYFLSSCEASAFYNVRFPLGNWCKNHPIHDIYTADMNASPPTEPSVRQLAAEIGLPVAQKPDSRGLCFIGPRSHSAFMQRYLPLPPKKLQFVDIDNGQIMHRTDSAQHAVLCTPGQGMRIGGAKERYFCVQHHWTAAHWTRATDEEYHSVTVCPGTHHPALYSDTIYIDAIQWWCSDEIPPVGQSPGYMRLQCRIRNLHPLTDCTIQFSSDRKELGRISIHLDRPLRGITRGQRVVFYTLNGLVCLGNAMIMAPGPSYLEQGRSLDRGETTVVQERGNLILHMD